MTEMDVELTSGNSPPRSRCLIPRIGRETRNLQFRSQHKKYRIRQGMRCQANKSPSRLKEYW